MGQTYNESEKRFNDPMGPKQIEPQQQELCRESAAQLLSCRIKEAEDYLAGLKYLHRVAEKLELDSPADSFLWKLLNSHRQRFSM